MAKKVDDLLEEENKKLEDVLVENKTSGETDNVVTEEVEFDAAADITAIFKGMDLSEEFKKKATSVYETSVIALASSISENVAKELKEKLVAEHNEIIAEYEKNLNEEVNGYVNFVVEKWLSDNEIAATTSIRTRLAESYMEAQRKLLAEYYVELPEEKVDLFSELEEAYNSLDQERNSLLEEIVTLRRDKQNMIKEQIVKESISGLTDVERDKFMNLSEAIEFVDPEDFTTKLADIRESYFAPVVEEVKKNFENEEPVEIVEEVKTVNESYESKFNVGPVLSHLNKARRVAK